MEKVSTMALCSLTSQIVSQTKKSVKKQSNGRCSLGMYNYSPHYTYPIGVYVSSIHTRVGFCVALP